MYSFIFHISHQPSTFHFFLEILLARMSYTTDSGGYTSKPPKPTTQRQSKH